MSELPSNAGYAAEVDQLFIRYEARPAEKVHAPWRHFFPDAPANILDIGAGTGRDAGWFASLGYRVVAAEPTDELRTRAAELHAHPSITWVDDILPDIPVLRARDERFDMILMHAVWMHLSAEERVEAMAHVVQLLAPKGRIFMSQRHGPIPEGRRMFDVSGEETVGLAAQHSLKTLYHHRGGSIMAENMARGIEWTKLVFENA
ncbi:MAG: class I SAM-dependent methyltransferase [Pseudomonadota bacterium]